MDNRSMICNLITCSVEPGEVFVLLSQLNEDWGWGQSQLTGDGGLIPIILMEDVVCIYICVYVCICICVCMFICMYIHMYICMYICMQYACIHMYVCNYVCTCMYVCMYVSM